MSSTENPEIKLKMVASMKEHLEALQQNICTTLEAIEEEVASKQGAGSVPAKFTCQVFQDERGTARPRVMQDGVVVEKAAVNFTHSIGQRLPPAATERKPELAGCGFQAVSLSLIIHPRNPHAPTTHFNFRLFVAEKEGEAMDWWFGGGFDLTPYFPHMEDIVHWHQVAKDSCDPHGPELYLKFKKECDKYFYLAHRKESRGIGGLFFDDWNQGGFEKSFALVQSISNNFLKAYILILRRRMGTTVTPAHRKFQCLRRGRYVEFNLLFDRGTKYGIQSGRRIESVLASMPPEVQWEYPLPEEESVELSDAKKELLEYLKPRDWLGIGETFEEPTTQKSTPKPSAAPSKPAPGPTRLNYVVVGFIAAAAVLQHVLNRQK